MKTENTFTFTCKVSNVDFTTPFHVESESHHSQFFFSHCSTGRFGWCYWFRWLQDTETDLLLLEVLAPTGLEAGFICHLFIFLLTSEYKFVVSFVSGTHGFTLCSTCWRFRSKDTFPLPILSSITIINRIVSYKWYKIHAWFRKHAINNVYCSRT